MKKIFIFSLFLCIIFLWGCSINNKLSIDQLFEKKQECITYKLDLQNRIDKDTENLKGVSYVYYERIEEIFYSRIENSCFAITDEMFASTQDSWITRSKRIINLLTNESTDYKDDQMSMYYDRVKELKWE